MNPHWYVVVNWSNSVFRFPQFVPMSFLCSWSPSRIPFSHRVSSALKQFRRLCFVMTLTVSRGSAREFCTASLSSCMSYAFLLMGHLLMCYWEGKSQRSSAHSGHISRVNTIYVTYHGWCWPWAPGLRSWASGFFTVKFLFLYFCCNLGEKVTVFTLKV